MGGRNRPSFPEYLGFRGSSLNIAADVSDMNEFGSDPLADAFVRIEVHRTDHEVHLDPFFVLFDDLDFGRIVDIAVSNSSEFTVDRVSFNRDGFLIQVSEPGVEGTVVEVAIYVEDD